jgi:acetylglutamate kinase
MKDVGQRVTEVAALKHALPYLQMFQGTCFVVKAGGGALADDTTVASLVEQVGILHQLGIKVVLVHGGGLQSSSLSRALGSEPRFSGGRRVTDAAALQVATMVLNGTVNTRVLAACRAAKVPAIGISGIDGGLVRARRRPPSMVDGERIDFGFVGDVVDVDASVVERLLACGFLPVVSPLCADDAGVVLNANADSIAAALAGALGAAKLVLITDALGILERPDDASSLVSALDLAGLKSLREAGVLRDGMIPKAEALERALRAGVRRAHVVSHRVPDSLLVEVFTNEGCGTLIVEDAGVLGAGEWSLLAKEGS